MATITKTKSGYRIQLYINGHRPSATFATKRECREWEAEKTYLYCPKTAAQRKITFSELLKRYRDEISPTKKGHSKEVLRINKILRLEKNLLCKKDIRDITHHDIQGWVKRYEDRGLQGSSIRREWTVLSGAFNTAIKKWGWLSENPMTKAERPKGNPPRERIINDSELKLMLKALDYSDDSNFRTVKSRCGAITLFALETAMRASEICALEWRDEDVKNRVVIIRDAKTRSGIRKVPLSTRACELIEMMRKVNSRRRKIFCVKEGSLSSTFYNARIKCGLEGFTFHDTRATACTRLAKKIQPYDLARVLGHKDLKMVMVYYREKAEDIAALLD
ncbi:tyrosine-type recombinase/integrase [Oligella urethralis]|uniref:tyrosine-type recombinase/integrase n=1 Tax=Oligella urethralis TaxID=90245 RepID=UPI0027B8AC46|nr:tyrosine-type recombinase/integrase [Oligella urethralis]